MVSFISAYVAASAVHNSCKDTSELQKLKSRLVSMKPSADEGSFVVPLPDGSWHRLPEMPLLPL